MHQLIFQVILLYMLIFNSHAVETESSNPMETTIILDDLETSSPINNIPKNTDTTDDGLNTDIGISVSAKINPVNTIDEGSIVHPSVDGSETTTSNHDESTTTYEHSASLNKQTLNPIDEGSTVHPTIDDIKTTASNDYETTTIIENIDSTKLRTNLTLLDFGYIYGRHLTTWLKNAGKIALHAEKASYEKQMMLGTLILDRGVIAVYVNAAFQPRKLLKRKLSQYPEGTIKSLEVYYIYFIPKIAITYNFTQRIWSKNVTGHFDIILKNQIIEAWLTAIVNSEGTCSYKDQGFDTTFNTRDYSLKIKFDGEGFVKKALTYSAQKVLNTFIIKWLLPRKVKKEMLATLEEMRKHNNKLQNGKEDDFYANMKAVLCNNTFDNK